MKLILATTLCLGGLLAGQDGCYQGPVEPDPEPVVRLRIRDLTVLPSTTTAGATLSLAWSVENLGTRTAFSVNVQPFLSADGRLDPSDRPLTGGPLHQSGLGPGSTRISDVPVTLPADTPAGAWRVLVVLQPPSDRSAAVPADHLAAAHLTVS